MATAGRIVVELAASDDRWSSTIQRSERTLKSFVNNAEKAFKNLTGQNGASGFASTFLTGAKAVDQFTQTLRTGGSIADALSEAVNKIPIVGSFKQAGEAIRELITGEKAALIQAQKLGEEAQRVSDNYRRIAESQSQMGLRGSARESRQAEIDADEKITAYHKAQEEIDKSIAEIEQHKGDLVSNRGFFSEGIFQKDNLSDAQTKNLEQLYKDKKSFGDLAVQERKVQMQREKEIEESAQREIFIFHRDSAQQIEALEAHMQAVGLRRQGKALESAMAAQREAFIQQQHAMENRAEEMARPFLKSASAFDKRGDTLNADKQREKAAAIYADTDKQIQAAAKELNQNLETLQIESDRRKSELVKDNEMELFSIRAEANIEKLKQSNDQLAAQEAQINLSYAREVAQLEKKYREENRADRANFDDPILREQLAAAAMKQTNALEAAAFNDRKSRMEEERKLWEQVGTPAQKYAAHLEEIAEQYEKLHDSELAAAQVRHLDADTAKDLKKFDAPQTKLELYGRRMDFKIPTTRAPSGGGSLEQLKSQVQLTKDMTRMLRDIWNVINKVGKQPVGSSRSLDFTGVP